MRVKKRLLEIYNDKLLALSFLIVLCELIVYLRCCLVSDWKEIEPLIRFVFCILYLLSALLFSKRLYYINFTLLALAIMYFNKFSNFTSFFIILLVAYKNPKFKNILFSLYFIDVVACLMIGGRQASHCLIHLLNCVLIYVFFYFEVEQKAKLKLTADEDLILKSWSEEGELKAVECFSHNSIFKKLKEARERNNINTNEELLERYKKENK